MTKDEAWKVVEANKGWNMGQKSISLAFEGVRTKEDDIYDAKRAAIAEAWKVIGRNETETKCS